MKVKITSKIIWIGNKGYEIPEGTILEGEPVKECTDSCGGSPFNCLCMCPEHRYKEEPKKIPCSCPKGGMDCNGRVCGKCGGSEWINPPKRIEKIDLFVKREYGSESNEWTLLQNKINEIIRHLNQLEK